MFVHPDWTPVPDFVRYGQVLRSANFLFSASEALFGTVDPATERVVRSMIDTMLRVAWDSDTGGFQQAGSSFGRRYEDGSSIFVKTKRWWFQADGMKALLTMARLHPDAPVDYAAHFVSLWKYVKKYIIDTQHGGWLATGLDSNPSSEKLPKATVWKDCSHEIEALLDCSVLLDAF